MQAHREEESTGLSTAEVKKKGVLVWNELSDVFKETSGPTTDRVVKFSIDCSRNDLNSKAPYWMALTELAILKEQLHDCSNKGLTRPSTSPSGSTDIISK